MRKITLAAAACLLSVAAAAQIAPLPPNANATPADVYRRLLFEANERLAGSESERAKLAAQIQELLAKAAPAPSSAPIEKKTGE